MIRAGDVAKICVRRECIMVACREWMVACLWFALVMWGEGSFFYIRPGTNRIPEGVPKKLRRNRNHDSCEKGETGTENTGILRIPAGITNLGNVLNRIRTLSKSFELFWSMFVKKLYNS